MIFSFHLIIKDSLKKAFYNATCTQAFMLELNQNIVCSVETRINFVPEFSNYAYKLNNVLPQKTTLTEYFRIYSGEMLLADLNNQPVMNLENSFALTSSEFKTQGIIEKFSLLATEAGSINISVILIEYLNIFK